MPVLVEQDSKQAAAMTALLADGAHVVAGTDQLAAWMQSRPDEYVVVLGPDVPLRQAAEVADKLRTTHPSAGVVLIRHELTTSVFESAMSAGIPSVVAAGDTAGLRSAVDRARQTWEAIHGPATSIGGTGGKVITVFSPKGGVGKTTMAVNLALALASDPAKRVCIIDLDLAFGDVAITLQLIPEHTIDEAVGSETTLDFSLLRQLLTRHADNVMILAAPTIPDARDRIPASLVRRVVTTLRKHFDFVVIDTSPGFDEPVLQAFDETDELVLVATLDVPTVKNMKMALETLDLLDLVKENRHLVLNRADDEVGLSVHNVETILKQSVVAAIPSDMAVASSTNHGRPIVLGHPDSPVSQSIRQLAARLAGSELPTKSSGRRGLLRRHKRNGA
ncbi:AAA family ATPase [Nocardioides terrisoli]|uniref:AAA family ATPase n=1 Tax=Nocardioides terrisoli TaxID=3388267 RepID=UPI00287BB1CC|nr:P-loop NTPase [Nocardioides marmorisolisilvae]